MKRLLVTAVTTFVAANLLNIAHFTNNSFWPAVGFAVVLGILNVFLAPILKFLGFGINFLTFGLFGLLVNGAMVFLAGKMISGIDIPSFGAAFVLAIIISLASSIFIKDDIA